jgi:type I site-specific restriction endonuclease
MLSGGQRGKQKIADYVLSYKNQKLALIEAKREDKEATEGLEQVKDYAKLLNIRMVYATNGKQIISSTWRLVEVIMLSSIFLQMNCIERLMGRSLTCRACTFISIS